MAGMSDRLALANAIEDAGIERAKADLLFGGEQRQPWPASTS